MKPPKQFHYKKNCLQQLRGFCYAAKTDNISKAAEKMGLSQSAITLQIQSLERDLGVKLFDRDKKRIKLNQDGKIFYQTIAQNLSGIESAYQSFWEIKKQQKPIIRIAVHHVAVSYLLPAFIKKFQKQYPDIQINIKNIAPKDAVSQLQDDQLDMILYPNIKTNPDFSHHHNFSYKPILIMHKNHPLAKKKQVNLTDIAKYNLVRVDKGLISLPLFEEVFKEFNFKTNIEFENGNWEMVKNFVKSEIGLGVISEIYLNKNDDDLITKDLSKHFPIMEYSLITKNGRKLSPQVQGFIECFLS